MTRVLLAAPIDPPGGEVEKTLVREGCDVSRAENASDLLKAVEALAPDIVVLDMTLPERSGFAVCREIREAPATASLPVLMLTPSDSELDRIMAFEAGADDVVQRPLFPRELALRVRAVVRRGKVQGPSEPDVVLQHGPIQIDVESRTVKSDNRTVHLSEREFAILALLARRPGRVFRRDEILESIIGTSEGRTPRVIDTHVKAIRRKLGRAGELIETLRGVGYRLTQAPLSPPC